MHSLPRTGLRVAALAVVALVTLLVHPPRTAIAETDAARRLDTWLSTNESLRAGFIQSVFDEDGLRIDASRGTVAFRRPYRFRWDYETPVPQIIVADGTHVWWYDVELEQVTVRPVDSALRGTPADLLAGPRRSNDHFRISSLASGDDIDWLELIPADPDSVFRAIRAGFEGTELQMVEMDDSFGQTTRIEFFDIEHNPRLSDALFHFEPPPGTDVVRGE